VDFKQLCAVLGKYEHVATYPDTRKPASKDVNQHGAKEKHAPICPDYPD